MKCYNVFCVMHSAGTKTNCFNADASGERIRMEICIVRKRYNRLVYFLKSFYWTKAKWRELKRKYYKGEE